jgi:hypothetical protein
MCFIAHIREHSLLIDEGKQMVFVRKGVVSLIPVDISFWL